MRTSSFLVLCLQCIHVLVSPEEHGERERRDLSMLRMGKRDHVQVVPARAISLPPLVPPNFDIGEDEFREREILLPEEDIPRQVWVPRVGKDLEFEGRYVRAPPFPRLGKTFEDYLNEIRRDLNDEEERQIYLKYPRVGRSRRSVDELKETGDETSAHSETSSKQKRSLPFPRLGEYKEEERAAPLPRLGLLERAAPLPRLGLREEDDDYLENLVDRAAPLPRLGLRENEIEERALPLPRMGYYDKRAMGMLRMGRSGDAYDAYDDQEQKRGVSMLRMGKRAMGMLRMGKRPMNMLRMGRSQETEEEKRAMSMLRMGKRAMGMLRMGRSDGSEINTEEEKRAMGMLRMGKRGMSMLRMGRSDNSEEEKRAMGMLRMGKRGMSMLRMGRSEVAEPPENEVKRSMGMLRMGKRPVSMLRMGKRDNLDNVDEPNSS